MEQTSKILKNSNADTNVEELTKKNEELVKKNEKLAEAVKKLKMFIKSNEEFEFQIKRKDEEKEIERLEQLETENKKLKEKLWASKLKIKDFIQKLYEKGVEGAEKDDKIEELQNKIKGFQGKNYSTEMDVDNSEAFFEIDYDDDLKILPTPPKLFEEVTLDEDNNDDNADDIVTEKISEPSKVAAPSPNKRSKKQAENPRGEQVESGQTTASKKRKIEGDCTINEEERLMARVKQQIKEKTFECKYWSCVSSYIRVRDLQLHQEKMHGAKNVTEGVYKCPSCQRGYSEKKQMNRHIKNAHRLLKSEYTVSYKCNVCDDAGGSVTNFKNHKISGHTIAKVYTCVMRPPTQMWGYSGKKCDYSHPNLTALRNHLKSHGNEQALKPDRPLQAKYSCNQCNYMSRRSGDLERHKASRCVTIQAYKSKLWLPSFDCELCGGVYNGERSLRKHLKTVCLSLKTKSFADRKLLVKEMVKTAVDTRKQVLSLQKEI